MSLNMAAVQTDGYIEMERRNVKHLQQVKEGVRISFGGFKTGFTEMLTYILPPDVDVARIKKIMVLCQGENIGHELPE